MVETIQAPAISRRGFLRASAAGLTGLAALGAGVNFWAKSASAQEGDPEFVGSWIRRPGVPGVPGDGATGNNMSRLSYARTELATRGQITQAIAIAAATHQYELWINGHRADFGQSFNHADRQYYQSTDVTEHLRSGELNAIGMRYHWYGGGQGRPADQPGIFVQIHIAYADGSEDVVATDETWRMRNAEWLPAPSRGGCAQDRQEWIDARLHPVGWSEAGFDDNEWTLPEVIGRHPAGIWETLDKAEARITEVWADPISVTQLDNGAYIVDFGKVMAAHPYVRFHDGQDGRVITMRAGYRLRQDGEVSTASRDNQRVNMSYQLIQKDGEGEFLPYHYLGFRYLQVDDPGEELTEADFRVKMRYSEVPDEDAATFESSNPQLDAVFELCRHSVLHGGQEQWVDTPTREKGGFLGDALLISYTSMRAFGERGLTRQGLREFKQSQERYWLNDPSSPIYGIVNAVYPTRDGARDIADYTQQYLQWAWWYYWETGDAAMLEELHTTCRHITEYVARHVDSDTGLIFNLSDAGRNSAYRFGIVDWPSYGRYGFPFPNNPNSVEDARSTINVFGVMVFRLMAQISEVIGRPQHEIDMDRQREAALTESINEHMIGPDGYYVSVVRRTGGELVQLDHAGQHANSYPLAFDIVPEENRQAVIDRVVELRILQGPMTCHWLLDAIENANLPEHLVDILTDEDIPGWSAIMARGATFTWESWEVDNPSIPVSGANSAGDSQSHPWGAVALIAIQRQLLGIRVTSPGASTLDIKPATHVLERAKGTAPTERGLVSVQWTSHPRGGSNLQVRIPPDTRSRIYIPLTAGIRHRGSGGGRPTFVGVEGDMEVFEAGPGPSNFVPFRA